MKRVLVLGGYGSFGARISQLLAKAGQFEIWVGGRSLEKAEAFCRSQSDLSLMPLRIDRDRGFAADLLRLRPWLVIDAAGPFQEATYDVAQACILSGSHYFDIADGRAFVENFRDLDAQARTAGLTLISGASSVPALSSAVVTQLARGLDSVGCVETSISASHRATVGLSVMRAILSYVGKPVTLKQAGRWVVARGWRNIRLQTYGTARSRPLAMRWVALCDVPDLALLSDTLPGRPLVIFRAGAELALENAALWLMSWWVQWGLVSDLRPFAGVLLRLRSLTSKLGGDRSAMAVRLVGLRGDQVIERCWTLIADKGQGPFTPCLATPLLAQRLAAGTLEIGAYAALGILSVDAFEAQFRALGFETEIIEPAGRAPLYRRVMGDAFDRLPNTVRQIHTFAGAGLAEGRASVTRGTNPIARMVARVFGFPAAGDNIPLSVRFFERDGRETWERRFGDRTFASELSFDGEVLIERFGVLRFGFELRETSNGFGMHLRRWWCGPVPMPLPFGPKGVAEESEVDQRFHFDVPISLPGVGLIVHYRGWLSPITDVPT